MGYGTGDGIYLKGFLFGKGIDIYAQVCSGTSLLFRMGLELNVSSVFFGVDFASMNISNNSALTTGVTSGFIGVKF